MGRPTRASLTTLRFRFLCTTRVLARHWWSLQSITCQPLLEWAVMGHWVVIPRASTDGGVRPGQVVVLFRVGLS